MLALRVIRSTSASSSDNGWLLRNILIGFIQSNACSQSGPSMTIRSASLMGSAGLIEGLDNFTTITSGEVGALKEAIHAR
jgi:hypothetical protein